MSASLAAALRALLAEGRPAAIVTVADAKGSTPRETGAQMLVAADGTSGSIGGGQLELRMIAQAREFLKRGATALTVDLALGPELGQCCGGHVAVTIARAGEDTLAQIEARERAAAGTRPPVLVFGAGHVGRALVRALGALPFRVRWIDERPDEFRDVRADNVEIVVSSRSEDEVRRAPPQAAYVVLTHSHSLDSAIVAAVLERGDFAYCGLIGSLTKRRVFERAFRETGIPEATIARLICPIGDRGVDDKRPEIIAALTAAELIEVFAGRSSR
jgi:xanthine dehydrogenase accessory factor/xanthine dehydrogenase large subunit